MEDKEINSCCYCDKPSIGYAALPYEGKLKNRTNMANYCEEHRSVIKDLHSCLLALFFPSPIDTRARLLEKIQKYALVYALAVERSTKKDIENLFIDPSTLSLPSRFK